MNTDISTLLIPITPEKPAGENLEYEPIFDDIRQARHSDPDYLPQDEWAVSEPRKADWNRVHDLCKQALIEQSKDLQLACWYAEALSHKHGLSGVRTGIEFLSEFLTRFWFQCWPSLEEDGLSIRRSKLLRLDRDLSQQLFSLPMLRQENSSLSLWQSILTFEHKLSTQPDDRDELIAAEGIMTMEEFDREAARFSSIEIGLRANEIEQLQQAFEQLEARYCSLSQDPDSDTFTLTRQTLRDLSDYLQRLAQRVIPLADETISMGLDVEEAIPQPPEAPARPTSQGQTMNRDVAIGQMLAIAGYFRQTEPSSPVPFLMERAARWANMTLTEWLEEMLHNEGNIVSEINNVLIGQRQ